MCYNIASVFFFLSFFLFMFWVFGHEVCGILAPRSGIKPKPAAFEGELLTIGPPGKWYTFVISYGSD